MEGQVILEKEVWADADGNPVPFGDERGKSVLYGAGAQVPESVAKALAPAEDKAVSEAPVNKAVSAPARKKGK